MKHLLILIIVILSLPLFGQTPDIWKGKILYQQADLRKRIEALEQQSQHFHLPACLTLCDTIPYKTPTFSAGNFAARGAGTWTVESGDVQTNRYRVLGKTMFWELKLLNTTTATGVTRLGCRLPESFRSLNRWIKIAFSDNNGTEEIILIRCVDPAAQEIEFARLNGGVFGNVTNDQDVSFNLSFEIQ